jgi:hypothetical protein
VVALSASQRQCSTSSSSSRHPTAPSRSSKGAALAMGGNVLQPTPGCSATVEEFAAQPNRTQPDERSSQRLVVKPISFPKSTLSNLKPPCISWRDSASRCGTAAGREGHQRGGLPLHSLLVFVNDAVIAVQWVAVTPAGCVRRPLPRPRRRLHRIRAGCQRVL